MNDLGCQPAIHDIPAPTERKMPQDTTSLHWLIIKWFGACDAQDLRITRLHGPGLERGCVRAERLGSARPLAIVFFRHQPRCWHVFPPTKA
ncbi:hypothetical protein V4C85_23655 [Ralstonia solanacearum]|uniref:hypothetical protein n=1 Tax=Ralstonia solanacearum TaxID=305 RepID=UPI001FFA8EEF